jgi:DNA polymerase-3 subunit gamma/tau
VAHQSLYRTYRPAGFDDVVGQHHITRTLRNAVAEGSVAHAYLFTGPRGTGKTTTARILAKALNCELGPTPDPDTDCEQCIDIAEGRHPDVHELDAASRTQVDVIREEIINKLSYAPTRGTWKIYIIDEVHMLSINSFNALLKSIEEPPARTVFILCTTHPHKVPETIHSRCQRFDFHRIGIEDIAGRLAYIAEKESIEVAEGTLTLIAKHAAGGMRDAITTFEQLAAFTGKNIALDDVEGLLGEVDAALLFEIAGLLAVRDVAGAFRFVARLAQSGVDMNEFVRELTGHVRDLYVISVAGDATGIVDTTAEQLGRLTSQAGLFGADRLSRILDLLGELAAEMRWSSDPRLSLEVAFTRMARPEGDMTLEALAERVAAIESGGVGGGLRAGTPPVAVATKPEPVEPPTVPRSEPAPAAPAPTPVPKAEPEPVIVEAYTPQTTGLDRAHVKRAWPAVLAEVKKAKPTRAHIFANTEVDVGDEGTVLVVEFPADQKFTMDLAAATDTRHLLANAMGVVLGAVPPFRYQLGRGAVQPIASETAPERTDTPPATVADETTTEAGSVDSSERSAEEELERKLMLELGANLVAEHPHDDDTGKDDE